MTDEAMLKQDAEWLRKLADWLYEEGWYTKSIYLTELIDRRTPQTPTVEQGVDVEGLVEAVCSALSICTKNRWDLVNTAIRKHLTAGASEKGGE